MPIDGGGAAAQLVADLDEGVRRQGDVVRRRLSERFPRLSVPSDPTDRRASRRARRPRGLRSPLERPVRDEPTLRRRVIEMEAALRGVAFESGHGIYVVPPGRQPADVIRRILVAWRDTRETLGRSRRLLRLSRRRHGPRSFWVTPRRERRPRSASREWTLQGISIGTVAVEIVMLESETKVVSDVLLERAGRMSADLIVMGAYGHSRPREWVLGGTTVECSTSPVPHSPGSLRPVARLAMGR